MTKRDDDWPETRAHFCKIALREGVRRVASAIPADPKTIYRIINGETSTPTRAVQASIERMVKNRSRKDPDP